MYISREEIEWVFPDKHSLKIGASVSGLKINITPKVNNDLRTFLEPSTDLKNKEIGQEEFSSLPTKEHFSREEKVLTKL